MSEGTSLVTPMNCESAPVGSKATKEDSFIDRLIVNNTSTPTKVIPATPSATEEVTHDPSMKLFQEHKDIDVIELDEAAPTTQPIDMSKVSLMPPLPPRVKETK